jgi:acetyltransferase-like isoleucine patch superfamily enzyme
VNYRSAPPAAWRATLAFLAGLALPAGGRRFIYGLLLGCRIEPSAHMGRAFVQVGMLEMAAGSRIGHFTVLRNINRVSLGKHARIGTFNWIFGFSIQSERHFTEEKDRVSALELEHHSSLTARHIIDCTDQVTIGAFSTVAGFNSQLLTHGIDTRRNRQSCAPIRIGRHCLIGSGCIIVKGAVVPDGAVLAAGSMFRGQPGKTYYLYSGVPALPVKALDHADSYFSRTRGPVD